VDVDDNRTTVTTPDSAPHFAVAGLFLEMLAAGDFGRLAGALDPDATMAALLPKGFREWHGAGEICAVFAGWFGDVDDYEVVDASVGQVGNRLQLRWRVRVRGPRLGEGARLVEQQVYAETGPSGRISGMRMLCSGYCPEHVDG
jgi:hypothetical protein